MKKLLALLAVVLAVVSCQKEINGLPVDRNGEAAASLSVALPEGATRAAGADSALGAIDNGVMDNYDVRFILEVYDMSGAVPELAKERMVESGQSTTATFTFRLVPGRDYNFVVWADFVEKKSQADRLYNTKDGLDEIEMYHKLWDAIDESRDAYTASVRVDNYNGTSKIGENGVITLTRPFAKLRVVTNDIKEMISIRPKTVTVKYFRTEFYAKYNALSETPYNAVEFDKELVVTLLDDQNNPVDVYKGEKPDSTSVQTLFADYFFASQEGERVMFTMDVETNHGPAIPQVTFNTNIPVKRNNLTTVYGPILTDANNVTVTIDPAFENGTNWNPEKDEYDVEVWDGMTVTEPTYDANTKTYTVTNGAQLAWIADQVNGVTRAGEAKTFIGETIVLANDIDLGGNRWTPIGNSSNHSSTFRGTFDGNGKKISNLSVSGGTGVGLFGMVSPKAIKNLTIENAVIYGTHYAGALAGWVQSVDSQAHNRGAITNCHVKNAKVVLAVEDKDNGDKAAGLVGYAVRIDVNRCSVENAEVAAYRDVAGLLGVAHEGCVVSNNVVKDVTVTADQTVEYGEVADSNAGEVVGRIMKDAVVENNTAENVTVIRKVDSTKEFEYALAERRNDDVIYVGKGEVVLPTSLAVSGINKLTVEGLDTAAAVQFSSVAGGGDGGLNCYADGTELIFKNIKVVSPNTGSSYTGGFGRAKSVLFDNCYYEGQYRSLSYVKFNKCTIDPKTSYIYTDYSNADFVECTFNCSEGKGIQVYNDGNTTDTTINVTDCTFTAAKQGQTWDGKPVTAIDINSNGEKFTVNINNSTATGFPEGLYSGESLFNIKGGAEHVTINIDGSKWVTSSSDLINTLAKGENATLSCDVNVGTTQLALAEGQEINLNGHTLTTQMSFGGISMKKGASIKGGTIEHTSAVAAIKAFNVGSIEDVTIKCTCTTPGKTITGIAIQNGGYVESIKNVTIEGATQCIEVGYQATVDTIDNVRVNGTNKGLIINGGKVKKAIGCTFKGANYGVYMHLKGEFAVGLELEDCDVEGTTASIYAFDEKGISNTSGSLTLTYDSATTLVGPFIWDFEDECKSVVTLNQPE